MFITERLFPTRTITFLIDQALLGFAFIIVWWLSFNSGLSTGKPFIPLKDNFFPFLVLNTYWLIIFAVFGMYGKWKYTSRFDEMVAVYKTITIGAILFVFIAFSEALELRSSKLIAFGYWAALIILLSSGRLLIRTIQRRLLLRGVGLRPSIIVGTKGLISDMLHKLKAAPALGYAIKGVVLTNGDNAPEYFEGQKVLGRVKDLKTIIKSLGISDVLIALEFKEDEEIFAIVSAADSFDVDFSILPGPADVLSGRMMFNHLYGFPMIRVLAEPMPPWEKNVKRMMDIGVSLFIGMISLPLMLLVTIAIKLESRGPTLYVQERVGHRGKKFKLWKFRSMVADAEKKSGPVWAGQNDMRITRVGKFIRKTRIDELPQVYNILKGDMSLVGPRPEREFFVEQLKKKIPYYSLRLKIKPGLTGWAQIKHNYDRCHDDVREKLKYDLYYTENMSLRMDLKILIATIFVVIGQKGAH